MNDPTDPVPIFSTASPLPLWLPPLARADTAGFAALIVRLIQSESTLYGITRDWHFDAATRKFVRLHALLEGQLPEFRLRLLRLAQHLPEPAGENWVAGRDDAAPKPAPADRCKSEAYAIHQLLAAHQALLAQLREERARIGAGAPHPAAIELVETLVGDHETDAFLLRALGWEVEHAH